MIAILSDIHGNLEALQAVLADVARFDVEAIYCLGDLVMYGPDPIPCVELACQWQVVLKGNHDEAACGDDELDGWGSAMLRRAMFRCRREVQAHPRLLRYLRELPEEFATAKARYVHGTPRKPLYEYVFPEDIYNPRKLDAILETFSEQICFCGHTHLPGIFQRQPSASTAWEYFSPADCQDKHAIGDERLLCNVGSVGQPRNGDPRACYVLYEPDLIRFRRVEYDIERTVRKLRGEDDGDFFGERLGRAS